MKTPSVALKFGAILMLLGGFLTEVRGQVEFDALTFTPGSAPVGYFPASVGWTFVPSVDMRVVDVGCNFMGTGPAGSFVEIDLWDGTNQIVGNYQIPLQNAGTSSVVYEPVEGLILKAGSPYGVSLENPPGGALPVRAYSRQSMPGPDGRPTSTFDTSPFLTQFENFQIATNNAWSPWPWPTNNSEVLLFGATFRFEVLRQLSCSPSANGILLTWPTQAVSFAVQQNSVGFNKATWVTLTNAPVVVGSQNQVVLPKPGGLALYRLISK